MSKEIKYLKDSFLSELKSGDDYEFIEKILIVIVLYNTSLEDSLTFQTLTKSLQNFSLDVSADLMICDNSMLPQIDMNKAEGYNNFNLYYLHDSTNPGISLSYNRAVELASVKQKNWIMVFDQDTELPIDAIKKYIYGLKGKPGIPIYVPKVYYNEQLLSPCRYLMYRGSPYKDIAAGIHTLQRKNVINSGLLIAIDAYIKVGGYDENVWLYYSDFVFFNRLKRFYNKFLVLDLDLLHNLSSSNYEDMSFALKRFTYYCQGARAASKSYGGLFAYIAYGITIALRSILMCSRFKSIAFIKVFYKSYFLSANENYIVN